MDGYIISDEGKMNILHHPNKPGKQKLDIEKKRNDAAEEAGREQNELKPAEVLANLFLYLRNYEADLDLPCNTPHPQHQTQAGKEEGALAELVDQT